jgi:hypothetical protein
MIYKDTSQPLDRRMAAASIGAKLKIGTPICRSLSSSNAISDALIQGPASKQASGNPRIGTFQQEFAQRDPERADGTLELGERYPGEYREWEALDADLDRKEAEHRSAQVLDCNAIGHPAIPRPRISGS